MKVGIHAVVLVLLAGSILSADVLITTDGTVIETQGEWELKGRVVVFTRPDGALASLRASEVDFDATTRYIEQAAAPPAPVEPPPPPPKARLVITDADVAHVLPSDDPIAAEGGDGTATETEATERQESRSVRVIAWEDDDPVDGEGRRIIGTLRNDGNTHATGVSVDITLFDDSGAQVARATAEPARTSLRPGESTTFSAAFPDVAAIGAAKLAVASTDLDIGGTTLTRDDDPVPLDPDDSGGQSPR